MDSLDAGVAAVFKAVITGDRDQIQKAASNYREPSSRCHRYNLYKKKDRDGRNILHYVCMYNTDNSATWMLSLTDARSPWGVLTPIPIESDKFGATAVMYAARAGMVTFVTQWIKDKRDIKTVDINNRNILNYCCGEGEIIPYHLEAIRKGIDNTEVQKVAQLLIINGITYSRLDQVGEMPTKYIDLTFDKCLSLNASDIDKCMNMWKVARETIRKLSPCQIYSPGVATWEAKGGLMHVCIAECFLRNVNLNNTQRVAKFEERIKTCKPDINEVDDYGMTALHYLCHYEFDCEPYGLREIVVGKILDLGADPNIKDHRGNTPLICAEEKGFVSKSPTNDPIGETGSRIFELLKCNGDTVTQIITDTEKNLTEQIWNIEAQLKIQELTFKRKLDRIDGQLKEQQETNAFLNMEMDMMKTSKDDIHNEMQQKLRDQCKEILDLKSNVEELKKKCETSFEKQDITISSLLLGNFILNDVARHLEADVQLICLPGASLEDLQVTFTKVDQKYNNVYLVTENKCTNSDLTNLIQVYRKFIEASKDKATKLIVASVLPTLDDVNDKVEQLNKALEALCQETNSEFVNNDTTFKYMNGATNDVYFNEDGETLSDLGINRLLRNLGFLATKKKAQAINI